MAFQPDRTPATNRSNLTQQIEQHEGERTPRSFRSSERGSPKPRSLSDAPKPMLSPSPAFREPMRRISKDDSAISGPSTPLRSAFHHRGLSLHLPSLDGTETEIASAIPRVPLSPKLDSSQIYGSPTSMLPRRSRGMDYTRACTNLHHSTLAEASPDASPITGRGILIPNRRSLTNNVLDSPSNNASASLWSLTNDRTTLSSSVSSVNMMGSDSDSDSDDSSDDMALDRETDDPLLSTPAASRMNGGMMLGLISSPGMDWMNNQASPAQASSMSFHHNLMSFRRARMRKGKSQHSSSSVSMNSSKPSPGPLSPGVLKSVETTGTGYFGGLTRQQVQSRRESLSMGTDGLHLSDSEDNGTSNSNNNNNNKPTAGQSLSDMDAEGPRGVIRRAVTRRGNLLPKTKGFARIRAALLEESAPIESEARREAEVIRQVQESDAVPSQTTSPVLHSNNAFLSEAIEDSIEDMAVDVKSSLPADSFSRQAEKNGAGLGFWNTFDERYRTPPPASIQRENSSAISDEPMDTPGSSLDNPALRHFNRSRSRSSTPLATLPSSANDFARRVNKRRRDDEFDPYFIKRRAVSPGMSVQSSPILPQSPNMANDKSWAKLAPKANGQGDRSNSGSSMNGGKKVGLQGMTETNDGIMSMSID